MGQTCNLQTCQCSGGALCGDGKIDRGEQCNEGGLTCPLGQLCDRRSCLCSGGGACGNRLIETGEQCGEPGLQCPLGQLCSAVSCQCLGGGFCGNGRADFREECNEPGLQCPLGQLCNKTNCLCLGGGACGNGAVDVGEECGEPGLQCELGQLCNGTTCLCLGGGACGDGVADPGEECRDTGFACTKGKTCDAATCRCTTVTSTQERTLSSSSLCGDGIVSGREECDDRNTRGEDGCSEQCLLESGTCGDGIVQRLLGEQCEVSLHDSALPYGCSAETCRFVLRLCGDGRRDPGEECDEGTRNSDLPNRTCRKDCSVPRCGDGVLDGNELCDDGNSRNGDGCDRYCRVERPSASLAAEVRGVIVDIPLLSQLPDTLRYDLGVPSPLASLTASIPQSHAPVGDTGPGIIVIMAAGAAGGVAWVRKRRKSP